MTYLDSILKKQRHYFVNKGPSSQGYGFSSSHVWMWELDYKESWALKNWCFWTVMLEKTLESPMDCKEIQPVHPKGNQSWIFIGRTDAEAEAEALIVLPPGEKNWLIGNDPDAGKDWRQKEKGTIEDEMIGWHHLLDGHEFEQALGAGILWIKENQISQVKEFSSFLCMGRCKSAAGMLFSHPEFLRAHYQECCVLIAAR